MQCADRQKIARLSGLVSAVTRWSGGEQLQIGGRNAALRVEVGSVR
jgi:hypothetical protein